jgi:hypothetical protein
MMVYTAPGGRVEDYRDDAGDHSKFHARTARAFANVTSSLKSTVPTALSAASAARNELGNNLKWFSMPRPVPLGVHEYEGARPDG